MWIIKPSLMVLGTTSDAGKSTIVAGLARLMYRMGVSVAPFKPQNMALNSAVTADGGEIGRAQALQAQACGLAPTTDMNPVLLKPSSDTRAQVIVHGKALNDQSAQEYHDYKKIANNAVLESFSRLQNQYQTVLIEGAGSPAEINLRQGDIANMGFAEQVDCPCILVADIDRGGVFAHIVGTLELLSPSEQKRIVGFVINRFRGDIALLQSGLDWLESRTGKPVIGVVPYLQPFYLDAEDAISTQQEKSDGAHLLRVVVPVLPRISNHTDFDGLRVNPDVELIWSSLDAPLPDCDLIILPGSKNVREDLQALLKHQWNVKIARHLRYGGKVLGICGGFQMLGETIEDPLGVEGEPGVMQGLGWIPMKTQLAQRKQLINIRTQCLLNETECPMQGYEIHHGESFIEGEFTPFSRNEQGVTEGYIDQENQIAATYCHGLFDQTEMMNALFLWMGIKADNTVDMAERRESELDRLADTLLDSWDFRKLNAKLKSSGYAPLDCPE